MSGARLRPDKADSRFIRRLAIIAIAVALVAFLYKITDLLLLVFGSAMGAVLLSGVADWITRRTPLKRAAALGIAIATLFAAMGFTGWLFSVEIGREYAELGRRLPEDWAKVQAMLSRGMIGRAMLEGGRNIIGGGKAARVAAGLGIGAGELLVNFLIVVVGALFFAAQPRLYRDGAVLLAPPPYRGVVGDALDDCGRTLRLWLLTQVVLMTSMGLLIGIGLKIAGVPSAAALGLLAGLSEFIPYVGPTLAMVPPLVIALAGSGSPWAVVATFVLVRMVQSNFITPLVQRRVVSVPPALTLFVILSFGYAFGTFGLFFSAPLLVVAYTLIGRLYVRETLGDEVPLPGEHEEERAVSPPQSGCAPAYPASSDR
jgi:predicted PurR-regulated permease PerM